MVESFVKSCAHDGAQAIHIIDVSRYVVSVNYVVGRTYKAVFGFAVASGVSNFRMCWHSLVDGKGAEATTLQDPEDFRDAKSMLKPYHG